MLIAALAAPAGHAAQDAQRSTETFQSRVDLIALDVAALDGSGRPVEDLRLRDFVVKIDGRERPVVSASLVKVERGAPTAPAAAPASPLVTTNVTPANARRVVIAVDQTLIAPKAITPLLNTASKFVDGLTPIDYAAFLAFPEPGPRVDFTTDKALVRKALQGFVGQPRQQRLKLFDISTTEAFEVANKERSTRGETVGPTTSRILERGCTTVVIVCLLQIEMQALQMVQDFRAEATTSLRRLESFLTELIPIEGSKTLVLVSAGLVVEDHSLLNEVVRLAALARTSINVIAVEPERDEEIRDQPNSQPKTTLQDRSFEQQGLETAADGSGGFFVRASGGRSEGIFDRVANEMSAWYVVAVNRQPGDLERQTVDVQVKRRGVTVRMNRRFVTAPAAVRRPGEEVLREALSSPIAISGVPLRVSTFAQRDGAAGKYRLHLAAQVGQPGTPPREYSVGYVVMNEQNRPVTSLGRRLQLAPAAGGGPNEPLHFDTALLIDPGAYSLRFGVVDPDGRRGTVIRRVELEPLPGEGLRTSDLIIGNAVAEGELLHPSVEPRVRGQMTGYLELYLPQADPGALTVALEIAEGEASPALATKMLNVAGGSQPDWRVASGIVDVNVLPGKYVARASIRRDGKAVHTVSRPFVLERTDPAERRQAERRQTEKPAVPITPEMQRQTASYVAQVVGNLMNVVAQEDFELTSPDRRIRSEFLLVPYPGSNRDLLSFRHVTHVNGKPAPNREERLAELFQKPIDLVLNRVRQIRLAAVNYVPSVFDPILGLAFLQANYQGRFEWTVNDAGAEWQPQVKAVTFVERARPTLLRNWPLGDQDVPARGTAWIEQGTGRLLQSELQIGSGRSATKALTRFKVDEHLQIMVPDTMRTENPKGVATYSNFSRTGIDTRFVLPDPK
ncbi:MAG TPA: VWA domain-containing protein [Vicinamibacterales bacterium]|nr:VWA domain-containing protein [Vicinamibacterales bacterium]